MVYKKASYQITIEKINGFGKHPGLYIGKDNRLIKVASFGNEKKAKLFQAWLEHFVFDSTPLPDWSDGDD